MTMGRLSSNAQDRGGQLGSRRLFSLHSRGRAARFDREYYRRYYFDARTAVTSLAEVRGRAHLIAAVTDYVGLPVRRILEAGCGTGALRAALRRRLPRAQYVALEASEYLCERYGWEHGRIETYRTRAAFDLVICYDVLQYLDTRTAHRALVNLARLCRGVLYFSALTRVDLERNCDPRRTDADVHLRSADWYRKRLTGRFREAGLGFWLRRGSPLTLWELESR